MDPNWGLLQKSAVDDETIEEAIARLVQAHDADETSHLETGEALQSHKASDIIDHLAASIVRDKFGSSALQIDDISPDKFYYRPSFDALTWWNNYLTGGRGGTQTGAGIVWQKPGTTAGDVNFLQSSALINTALYSKAPGFKTNILLPNSADNGLIDFYIAVGASTMTNGAGTVFGFWWKGADEKMYAHHSNVGGQTDTEITDIDWTVQHSISASISTDGDTITYYVDGTQVDQHTSADCLVDSLVTILVGTKDLAGGTMPWIYWWGFLYWQNF